MSWHFLFVTLVVKAVGWQTDQTHWLAVILEANHTNPQYFKHVILCIPSMHPTNAIAMVTHQFYSSSLNFSSLTRKELKR